jgi:hypothetical protein
MLQVTSTLPGAPAQDILPMFPHGAPPEFINAYAQATRNVLERHGPSAFEAPRDAAITHEVGHAIVGTHEEFTIRSVRVFARSVNQWPLPGTLWGGRCLESGGNWTTGPDSSAANDLRRARFIIAGLAGETAARLDRPGSSLDELIFSQIVGANAASKLADYSKLRDDAEYTEYVKCLWHEQVWGVVIAILRANWEVFNQLAVLLQQHEQVRGGKLRKVLAQVRRIEQ